MSRKVSVERYGDELADVFSRQKMVIFLCGPTLNDLTQPGAQLRSDLKYELEARGFDVVLGEDDGLEELRRQYGHYAHENELQFIQGQCNAVVLIASSPGALCELGLFSYKKVHSSDNSTDFILILDQKYKGKKSYIYEGPVTAIEDFGKVYYGELSHFDCGPILSRLIRRRAVYFTDTRGRPPGKGL